MIPPYTLQQGLPAHLLAEAAQLYWQAFGEKLGFVLGPEPAALAYLQQVIRTDHALIALSGTGHLLGLAGFKTPQASFVAGGAAELRASYGLVGGTWRARLLGWLSQEVDNRNFLLDGLCVAPDYRGYGLGTALMGAVCTEAQARGYGSVRLDVVDSNWRAQALYRRLGFVETQSQSIGLLRHVFGFSTAITMVLQL